MDFLWLGGCGPVPPAQDRTQSLSPLPLLGLSVGSRPLRSWRTCPHHQYPHRAARTLHHRSPPDSRRPAVLQALDSAESRYEQSLFPSSIEFLNKVWEISIYGSLCDLRHGHAGCCRSGGVRLLLLLSLPLLGFTCVCCAVGFDVPDHL